MEKAPEKPERGQPCNGCGFCCAVELCAIAEMAGEVSTPCTFMRFVDDRFRCGLVEAERSAGMEPIIKTVLGIGTGCLV